MPKFKVDIPSRETRTYRYEIEARTAEEAIEFAMNQENLYDEPELVSMELDLEYQLEHAKVYYSSLLNLVACRLGLFRLRRRRVH